MEEQPAKPKKSFIKYFSNTVILLCGTIIVFTLGFKSGSAFSSLSGNPNSKYSIQNLNEGNKNKLDFSLFWQTWNAIEENYIDRGKIKPQELYYGAIKGMVASLGDSYTYFLTPEEFQESKDELHGTFEGIGAELGLKQGQIVIVSPLKDSPAEKAGLLASDIILKVDGKKTDNWTLHEAVNKIRGPHGKKVTLTVFRQSIQDEKTISVVRDKISIKFVELTYENDVAIVELSRFGDDTVELWNKSVDEIASKWKQGKVKGMVLDLRGNPGGFLDGAVYISSEFLHEGDVVVKQEYSDKKQDIYRADREGKLVGIPLTILINGGSASASEIVAGALRDNKKATLVGEKSFGKGTVQQVFDLSNNAGVHITISRWILPKGDWIHENGIKPNIEVKNEDDLENTLTRDKDKQLDKAIEVLKK
jgi:carboxyl-terminal processing protease